MQCTETCYVPQDGDRDQAWEFTGRPRVHRVAKWSPAADAGIRNGDVILSVDGLDITSETGGRRFGTLAPREVVEFRVRRGSEEMSITLRVGFRNRQ